MKIKIYWDWFGFDWFKHTTRFMFDIRLPYLQHQYSIGFIAFCWKEFEKI